MEKRPVSDIGHRVIKDVSRTWNKRPGNQRENREQRVQAKRGTCQEVVEEIRGKLPGTEVASSGKGKERETLDPSASPFSEDLESVLKALEGESQSAYNEGLFMYNKDKSYSATCRRDAGEARLGELVRISEQLEEDSNTWSRIFEIQKDIPFQLIGGAERQFKAVIDGYKQSLKSASQADKETLNNARQEFLTTASEIENRAPDEKRMWEEYSKLIDSKQHDIQIYMNRIQERLSGEVASQERTTKKTLAETGVASSSQKGKGKETFVDLFPEGLEEKIGGVVQTLRKESVSAVEQAKQEYVSGVRSQAGENRLGELVSISGQLEEDFNTWSRIFEIQKDIPSRELFQLGGAERQFKAVIDGYKQSLESTSQADKEILDHDRNAFLKTASEIENRALDEKRMREEYSILIDSKQHDIQIYMNQIQERLSGEVASRERTTKKTPAETGVSSSQKGKGKETSVDLFPEGLKKRIDEVVQMLRKESISAVEQAKQEYVPEVRSQAGENRLGELVIISGQLEEDFNTWSSIRDSAIRNIPSSELPRLIMVDERQFKVVLDAYKQSLESTSQTDKKTLDLARDAFLETPRNIRDECKRWLGRWETTEGYGQELYHLIEESTEFQEKIEHLRDCSDNLVEYRNSIKRLYCKFIGKEEEINTVQITELAKEVKGSIDAIRREETSPDEKKVLHEKTNDLINEARNLRKVLHNAIKTKIVKPRFDQLSKKFEQDIGASELSEEDKLKGEVERRAGIWRNNLNVIPRFG